MKAIAEVFGNPDDTGRVTVVFADGTRREYRVQYTGAGRRYIRVYGKVVYDHRGKAI
jgi:hypothetical protein